MHSNTWSSWARPLPCIWSHMPVPVARLWSFHPCTCLPRQVASVPGDPELEDLLRGASGLNNRGSGAFPCLAFQREHVSCAVVCGEHPRAQGRRETHQVGGSGPASFPCSHPTGVKRSEKQECSQHLEGAAVSTRLSSGRCPLRRPFLHPGLALLSVWLKVINCQEIVDFQAPLPRSLPLSRENQMDAGR